MARLGEATGQFLEVSLVSPRFFFSCPLVVAAFVAQLFGSSAPVLSDTLLVPPPPSDALPSEMAPSVEDRRVVRRAWTESVKHVPPLMRSDIETWIAMVDNLQLAVGGEYPELLRDSTSVAVLVARLLQYDDCRAYALGLLSLKLDWDGFVATLRRDFAHGLEILAERLVQARLDESGGGLADALNRYCDLFLVNLRSMGLDPYLLRKTTDSTAAGSSAASVAEGEGGEGGEAGEDEAQETASVSSSAATPEARFYRGTFALVRAQFERGLPLDVRAKVIRLEAHSFGELLAQVRRVVAPEVTAERRAHGAGGRSSGLGQSRPKGHKPQAAASGGEQAVPAEAKPSGSGGVQRGGGKKGAGAGGTKLTCFNCQQPGHTSDKCPKKGNVANAMVGGVLAQGGAGTGGAVPSFYAKLKGAKVKVLLDSGASFDCISPGTVSRLKLDRKPCPELKGVCWGGTVLGTSECVEAELSCNDFAAPVRLAVVSCPADFDVVLGATWHRSHGVVFDWVRGEVSSLGRRVFGPGDVAPVGNLRGTAAALLTGEADTLPPAFGLVMDQAHEPAPELGVAQVGGSVPVMGDGTAGLWSVCESPSSSGPAAGGGNTDPPPDFALSKQAMAEEYERLAQKFPDVFCTKLSTLPPPRPGFDFEIELVEGARLKPMAAYRMSDDKVQALRALLQPLIDSGMAVPADDLPAFSAAFVVPKRPGPDGRPRWRCVLDCRALNACTKPFPYLPQLVEDQVRSMGDSKIFGSVDLADAFWQVRCTPETSRLLTFATPFGKFRLQVMPQGAKNSGAYLTRLLEHCFQPLLRRRRLALYADDSVGHGRDIPEFRQVMDEYFELCRQHHLRVNLSKCDLFKTSCDFLGFHLGHGTIDPLADRISALATYPEPKDRRQLRAFLGGVAFYHDHFPNVAIDAAPLNKLAGNSNVPFRWTEEMRDAFHTVLKTISNPSTLVQPRRDQPIHIYTDASIRGFGVVIMQDHGPLAFLSKACNSTQAAWPVAELELYAVRMALRSRPHWFGGSTINVYSDHQTLSYFATKMANKRLLRHFQDISEFNVTFHYLKGEKNQLADLLSRRPDYPQLEPPADHLQPLFRRVLEHGQATTAMDDDDELWGEKTQDLCVLSSWISASPFPSLALQQLIADGYHGSDLVAKIKAEIAAAEEEEGRDTDFVRRGELIVRCPTHTMPERIVVVPHSDAMREILKLFHDENCHIGRDRLYHAVAEHFFIPGLCNIVRDYVRTCPVCQRTKIDNSVAAGLPRAHAVPGAPWRDIAIDFVTGLPASGPNKYDCVLVVVCKFTKRAVFVPTLKTVTAEETAMLLMQHVAAHYGAFSSVTSDRGPQFTSDLFRTVMDRLGVNLSMATAHHPASNGEAERFVRTLVEALRASLTSSKEDWSELLPFVAMSINSAKSSAHGQSPFTVDTGRTNGTFFDVMISMDDGDYGNQAKTRKFLQLVVADALTWARMLRNEAMGRKRRKLKLKPGESVTVSQMALLPPEERSRHVPKLRDLRVGPFLVKSVKGNAVELELPRTLRAHNVINISHIRKYHKNDKLHPDSANNEPPVFRSVHGDFYQVESIVGHSEIDGKLLFTVKWAGYDHIHNSSLQLSDFVSGFHIRNYCEAVGLPIPPDTPP